MAVGGADVEAETGVVETEVWVGVDGLREEDAPGAEEGTEEVAREGETDAGGT